MTPATFRLGDLVRGRYRLMRQVGEGAMAEVFLAVDEICDQREVAVKVPKAAILRDATTRERFRRETRRLLELEHPHVVPLYDAGVIESRPFQVMAFMPRGSLADRRQRLGEGPEDRRVLPVTDLPAWLPDVASALDYMHSRGVIHRDVKPANLLFDAADRARVSDFGISKALHGEQSLTPDDELVGTATYLPPEAVVPPTPDAELSPPSPAFDQYGLATVVFEMLCGFAPFPGGSAVGVLYLKAKQPAPSLARACKQSISPRLVAAVDRALLSRPEARWPSCAAFVREALG